MRELSVIIVTMALMGCALTSAPQINYTPKPHFSGDVELVRAPVTALEEALNESVYEYGVHGEAWTDISSGDELEGTMRAEVVRAAPSSVTHEEGVTHVDYETRRITLTYLAIATFEILEGIEEDSCRVELKNGGGELIVALEYAAVATAKRLIDALAVLNPNLIESKRQAASR